MRIPVFDLDWTLIKKPVPNIHELSFKYAISDVCGVNVNGEKSREGWIDNQILLRMMESAGVNRKEAEDALPRVRERTIEYFIEYLPDVSFEVLPGVVDTLEEIKKREIPMGVLTGNIEDIAWLKLENAGIREYFSFGAFGNEALKRSDLVIIAHTRAQKKVATPLENTDMVVIGDTIHDVICAKDAGALSVAVATRPNTRGELQRSKPDLLMNSFEERELLLNFINTK